MEPKSKSLAKLVSQFYACERGATAIEYTLIAAGVGLAVSATVYNVGNVVLNDLFLRIQNAVSN